MHRALLGMALGLPPASACLAGGIPATLLSTVQVVGDGDADGVAQADAASTGIVTQAQFENRPISRPAEVLEVVPGLVATQHSGDGKANQYFLRGFNLDHGTDLAASIDGVPNNLRTHGHGQGYNDLNALIPELIDTIEYRKGPYYADDGDFSSAGAVRIRYKERLDGDFYQLGAGEHGYGRALLAASGEAGAGRWLGAADLGAYDGPWKKPQDERKASLVGRYGGGDAERGYHVTLMAYRNRWDASDQIPRRAVAQGLVDAFGQVDPDLGGDTSRYTAAAGYHMPLGGGRLAVDAYAVRYDLDLFSNFTYYLDDPVRGDQFEQRDRRSYYGGSARYLQHWSSGGVEHEIATGVEARYDDIGTVGLYHTAARQRLATVREDAVQEGSIAAYLSYSARWNRWLRIVAGVRYDRYRADVDSNIAANTGTASDGRASPKLSVVLGPWRDTEFFVNVGRGFHSNDARGSTLNVDPNDPAQPAQPLQLLVPTTGAELGMRTDPADGLTLSAALWRLAIGSELVFSGDGGTTEPSFPSTRHGLELSAYWRPVLGLLIDADYARSYARFSADNPAGIHVPNAVERTASLGATFSGSGRWSGGLRYRYLGPAPLIEDNSVRSHSTTLVNATTSYRLDAQFRLSFEVLNLFDSKANDITYFYESRLAAESDPVADIHFHPVEPRQFRVTLRGTF